MSADSDRSPTIVVADEDGSLRSAMAQYLSNEGGYRVEPHDSGRAALDALRAGAVDVLILSLDLPDLGGLELVEEALAVDRHVPIIVMADLGDATLAAQCVQRGAYADLTKPIDPSELGNVVQRATEVRNGDPDGDASKGEPEADPTGEDAAHVRRELEQVITGTLEIMVSTIEGRDPTLVGHSQRVATLAATIADEMDLPVEQVEKIRLAGRFHDLGKIGISEELLRKRESHTDEELRRVREHCAIGERILAGVEHLGDVPSYVRSHHEHWDGSGYPDGLSGADIPIGGRVLCAVEVFDALTTAGEGRSALGPVEAVRRMMALEGTVIDPDVLVALSQVIANDRYLPFLVDAEERLNVSGIVMIPKKDDE